MRKTAKCTTRKKNLASKPLVQRVKNAKGETFTLANGRLTQSFGSNGGRFVRLSNLREAINSGGAATVITKYAGQKTYNDVFGVRVGKIDDDKRYIQVGCQIFLGRNAEKILKRARVTV